MKMEYRVGWRDSWSTRLILYALLIVAISLVAFGVVAFTQSSALLSRAYALGAESATSALAQDLQKWLGLHVAVAQNLAADERVQSMNEGQYTPVIQNTLANYPTVSFFIVIGPDGKERYNSANTAGAEGLKDLSDRAYFKAAIQGQVVVMDPVVSRTTGKAVIVIAAPIVRGGEIVGVLAEPVRVDTINELLAGAAAGKTGEAYLVNPTGLFLTPSRFDAELKDAGLIEGDTAVLALTAESQGVSSATAGESGSAQYVNYRGRRVIGAYQPIRVQNAEWALLVEQDASEILAPVTTLGVLFLVIALVVAALVMVFTAFLSRRIIQPITHISQVMTRLAEGDLQQAVTVQGRDEIGRMGNAIRDLIAYMTEMAGAADEIAAGNLKISVQPRSQVDQLGQAFLKMISNLRNLIETVRANASAVTETSRQLAVASEQASQATTQIAMTIQHVARGTSSQTESISVTAAAINQMTRAIDGVAKGAQEQASAVARSSEITGQISTSIDQVAGNADAVVRESKQAAQAARDGAGTVQETLAGMTRIRTKVDASAEKVQEMGSRSNQIGEIVTTIEDIASQTNLLALNAAIEAARAGDAGKGFAVVADEVRKLAERASAATREIGELVRTIQHTVDEAVSSMAEGSKEVNDGVVMAEKAGAALKTILSAAESVNVQAQQAAKATSSMSGFAGEMVASMDTVSAIVEENTASTEEMSANSQQVSSAIENIAAISEENSAAVEEVSASTEEMSAQVQEVTASAAELARLAGKLQQVVETFRLN